MSNLIRFGVSMEADLIKKYDQLIKEENYSNRSEALRDLIRESLVREAWRGNQEVAGTITIVYEHDKKGLLNELTKTQHQFHCIIISTQHIHLNAHQCLEVLVIKGPADEIQRLASQLKSIKGVMHSALSMTATESVLTAT
jgi:CopG family nickel-responsive transcriptional regulator